ncbi:hypothetical protein N7520_002358 [Penicillium odoratum]|uniref:uncharacterized protein n=1 Tax=Penicillium odoratum TaxID=1167516 RepID=UPI0025466673|nr:uncharacterized protein N7520_002358 [Penicillium odoratum]KAJ5771829.1 hypothetical protein N7520_002358 [Penicillium odoratum]
MDQMESSEPQIEANHGDSVPDVRAMGDEQESQEVWRQRCGIKTDKQIRLVKLVHMRYQHPDLELITTFLHGLPSASEIQELTEAPGGGYLVTLTDPDGFPINLIWGQSPSSSLEDPPKLIYNFENEKPRVRKFQRFTPGPAAVHKLGHYGLCTQNFEALVDFYTTTFNIVPSDFMYTEKEGQKQNVAMFAHIDRGEDYVDHHSIFLNANDTPHVHHCSFEVHDFDTQKLGHQWLAEKGYESVWGVGRHILGSQIFDYWWDTTGNMIEHYADGDIVNCKTPVGYGLSGDASLAVWGPEVPAAFLQ